MISKIKIIIFLHYNLLIMMIFNNSMNYKSSTKIRFNIIIILKTKFSLKMRIYNKTTLKIHLLIINNILTHLSLN